MKNWLKKNWIKIVKYVGSALYTWKVKKANENNRGPFTK